VTDNFCFSEAAPDQHQSNSLKYSFHPNFTDKHSDVVVLLCFHIAGTWLTACPDFRLLVAYLSTLRWILWIVPWKRLQSRNSRTCNLWLFVSLMK